MSTFPYRNNVNRIKNDRIINIKYDNHKIDWKPSGLWYSIRDSMIKWGELDFGNYLYEIKLKPNSLTNINNKLNNEDKNKILSMKNVDDIDIFNAKYGRKYKKYKIIDWNLVSLNYGGFEIKNYEKIMKNLREEKINFYKYSWLYGIDFSSGCIWNLNIIKEKNFVRKLNNKT